MRCSVTIKRSYVAPKRFAQNRGVDVLMHPPPSKQKSIKRQAFQKLRSARRLFFSASRLLVSASRLFLLAMLCDSRLQFRVFFVALCAAKLLFFFMAVSQCFGTFFFNSYLLLLKKKQLSSAKYNKKKNSY